MKGGEDLRRTRWLLSLLPMLSMLFLPILFRLLLLTLPFPSPSSLNGEIDDLRSRSSRSSSSGIQGVLGFRALPPMPLRRLSRGSFRRNVVDVQEFLRNIERVDDKMNIYMKSNDTLPPEPFLFQKRDVNEFNASLELFLQKFEAENLTENLLLTGKLTESLIDADETIYVTELELKKLWEENQVYDEFSLKPFNITEALMLVPDAIDELLSKSTLPNDDSQLFAPPENFTETIYITEQELLVIWNRRFGQVQGRTYSQEEALLLLEDEQDFWIDVDPEKEVELYDNEFIELPTFKEQFLKNVEHWPEAVRRKMEENLDFIDHFPEMEYKKPYFTRLADNYDDHKLEVDMSYSPVHLFPRMHFNGTYDPKDPYIQTQIELAEKEGVMIYDNFTEQPPAWEKMRVTLTPEEILASKMVTDHTEFHITGTKSNSLFNYSAYNWVADIVPEQQPFTKTLQQLGHKHHPHRLDCHIYVDEYEHLDPLKWVDFDFYSKLKIDHTSWNERFAIGMKTMDKLLGFLNPLVRDLGAFHKVIDKGRLVDKIESRQISDVNLLKDPIPLNMIPEVNRGVNYTNIVIDMRGRRALYPTFNFTYNGEYFGYDMVTDHGPRFGTVVEPYDWSPTDEKLIHKIEPEKVKLLEPLIYYLNFVADLKSTCNHTLIFDYYGPISTICGMRHTVLKYAQECIPTIKEVRLESERLYDPGDYDTER